MKTSTLIHHVSSYLLDSFFVAFVFSELSVWKKAHYVDDAAQTVIRSVDTKAAMATSIAQLLDFKVGDYGKFDVPFKGNNPYEAYRNKDLDEKRFFREKSRLQFPGALVTFGKLKQLYFGIHGVYRFLASIRKQVLAPHAEQYEHEDFFSAMVAYYGATGNLGRNDVVNMMNEAKNVIKRVALRPYKIATEMRKLLGSRGKPHAMPGRDQNEPLKCVDFMQAVFGKSVKAHLGLNYTVFTVGDDQTGFVITDDDVDRVMGILIGIGAYRLFHALNHRASKGVNEVMLGKADGVINVMFNSFARANKYQSAIVCRAFDVFYHLWLGRKFSNVNDDAWLEQKVKFSKEGLVNVIDAVELDKIVTDLEFAEAQELLMVHRCLPAPDFDQFSMMNKQRDLYRGEVNRKEHDPDGNIFRDIMRNYKIGMCLAFKRKHGSYPGKIDEAKFSQENKFHREYPAVRHIGLDNVDDIDFKGCFQFSTRDKDILKLVKDKAVCPESVARYRNLGEYAKLPINQRSQLLDAFTKKEDISMVDLRARVKELFVDVKADDKPEAKKPNGRMFFEAPTEFRLLQSEYEESVADYVTSLPQVMFGKTEQMKRTIMNEVCHSPNLGEKPLFISFDLHRWSPWMKLDIHKAIDDLWAGAFGMSHVQHMSRIFSEGKIHYIRGNIHHTMDKMGRDFEGFAGKKLTLFHYAVMRTCVQHLNKESLIMSGPGFAAQIDDGLLKANLKHNYQDVPKVKQVLIKVYGAGGLQISWDKTYLDDRWNVFLNEVRCYATCVYSGVRAFLKMNDRSDSPIPSLRDDVTLLESRARGALIAGSRVYQVISFLSFLLADTMKRWIGRAGKLTERAAFWMFAPVALGGIGCQSFMNLMGSFGGVPLSDSIGCMRAIVLRFNQLRDLANSIINQKIRKKDESTYLSAPFTIRREEMVLSEGSIRRAVLKSINRIEGFARLATMMNTAANTAQKVEKLAVGVPDTVDLQFMGLVYACTPEALIGAFADKFLKSNTLRYVVGYRVFNRIVVKHRVEVREVYNTW